LLSLFFPAENFGLPSSLPVAHESAAGSFLSLGVEFGPVALHLIPPSCSLSPSAAEHAYVFLFLCQVRLPFLFIALDFPLGLRFAWPI
jgi:hypothetical protein